MAILKIASKAPVKGTEIGIDDNPSFVLIPIENCPVKGLSGWMPAVTGY